MTERAPTKRRRSHGHGVCSGSGGVACAWPPPRIRKRNASAVSQPDRDEFPSAGSDLIFQPHRIALCVAGSSIVIGALFSFAATQAWASPTAPPTIHARAAALASSDGTVLWSSRGENPRHVASVIKLLTALVVREKADLDEVVVVPRRATVLESGAGLVKGQKLTVRQLLQIMLVHSANDAAEALAVHVGGSEKEFVAMMNAKAKELGLKHTHAVDAHGLSKREVSTAEDLTIVARHVLADPVLASIVQQTKASVPRGKGKPTTVGTTDRLLGRYPGMLGLKTGYTDPAGYCFVGAAKHGDTTLIGVVLGTDSSSARFTEMRRLLDWGFSHTEVRDVVSSGVPSGVATVTGGETGSAVLQAERSLSVATLSGGSPITTAAVCPDCVSAPVRRGQQVGTLEVRKGAAVLATVPLVAVADVPAATPVQKLVAAIPASSRGAIGGWQGAMAWVVEQWRALSSTTVRAVLGSG